MEIIEYDEKYLEDVKDLLVELEEYIISIDKDNLDQLHPDYREKMALLDLEEVNNNNGKCYLAVEDGKAVGLIMGCIPPYDEYDYLDYKCPKRGEITELIEEYRAVYKEEYEKKEGYTKDVRIQTLMEEYKKTFALTDVEIAGELTPVYELKYSKSKNVWTLYYLENYVAKKVKDLNNLLTQKLYEQKVMPIESFLKELDGIAIVSNVPYLLAISSNVDMLKQNLIKEQNYN